jgi:hypothetical protein
MDIRGKLYWIFRCDPSDRSRWLKDKYLPAALIDICLMYLVAIPFGLLVIKILLYYKVKIDGDTMKYGVIILTNLMLFFVYYMMHKEPMDKWTEKVFDTIFNVDLPRPKGGSVDIPDKAPKKFKALDKVKKGIKNYGEGVEKKVQSAQNIKYRPLWGGATVYMGEDALFKI